MPKDIVMRGQTASGETETLNFSGTTKEGYAYRLVEFQLWNSTAIGTAKAEQVGTITAGKTAEDPVNPNFKNEGLIGVAALGDNESDAYGPTPASIVNDTFPITQNLLLMVQDTGGTGNPINWQCRFVSKKMSKAEQAVANYHQFMISDG
tara:strand:- start:196 stop:645 length:450 start_codon:yes stop_codon:yes gene_type:complete